MLIQTIMLLTGATLSAAQVRLPQFSGKFPVGTVSFPITDESRDDPLAITQPQKRRVMVQLFYPTTAEASAEFPAAPYGPALSLQLASQMFQSFGLPHGLDLANLTMGVSEGSPVNYDAGGLHCSGKLPLVFFSHGVNAIRLVSGHASADLASHGYVVAAIDHPFDAPLVEFPGGEIVPMNPKFNALQPSPDADAPNILTDVLAVRVADIEFLTKTMTSDSFSVPGFGEIKIDATKVGVFGHSLGGAAAADVMLRNKNVAAGANLDGPLYGQINATDVVADLGRPFMLMKYPEHTLAGDSSLSRFVSTQKKVKTPVIDVKGAGHISFCDLPLLLDVLGVDRSGMEKMPYPINAIGTIAGDRMNRDLTVYVSAFFDKHLMGQDNGLLSKETDAEFPEVVVSNL